MKLNQRYPLWAVAVVLVGASSAVAAQQYKLTTLATFDRTTGAYPFVGVVMDSAGNLFGATRDGGTNNLGTLFELAARAHAVTTLVNFDGTNGAFPVGGLLLDASGNLYGTTNSGGANGVGTVFKVAGDTHALNTLADFNGTNGAYPYGAELIADVDGNLYGTTSGGGDLTLNGGRGRGTVFELVASTNTIVTLATFNGANGYGPNAGLIADASGNLYGTTGGGGTGGSGTVFKVAAGTHVLSTLANFDHLNGGEPRASLVMDAAGNLYGTTTTGSFLSYGTVFEIAAGTNTLTTLVTFDDSNGSLPHSNLIADASGNLYGTTLTGGSKGGGTVFKLAAGTHALTILVNLDAKGTAYPEAGLIADGQGNFYGTTFYGGGAGGFGAVFELSPVPEPPALTLGAFSALGSFGLILLVTRSGDGGGR